MKIGVVSDLHLEASNMSLNNPGWDVLVLAGDISADRQLLHTFFDRQCPTDIPVVYVLGNHEHEGCKWEEVIPEIRSMLKEYPNVHLLHNESLIVNNVKFIGSTLWSNFEGCGINEKAEVKEWAKINIADFHRIYKIEGGKKVCWTPNDMESEFNKAYQFLEYELKNNTFDGHKFVVTHFAPHPKSVHDKFKGNIMNSYWVNNLENLMGFSDYWVHGHTHSSLNYNVEGTKVICNPRGYSKLFNLAQNQEFNPSLMIDIPSPQKKIKP